MFGAPLVAAETAPAVSGPFSQGNLTVFLLRGTDTIPAGHKLLTLDEAIEQKKLIVHETSNVNQLAVENVSDDVEVFIQSGDIVKGGRQDRLIACDMVVPPKSGKLPISSFCCENGRWQKRGAESDAHFGAANAQAANRELKLAVNEARDQSTVWKQVAEAQKKLEMNLGKPVANAASPSSYQLTLEDKELLAKVENYTKDLKKIAADNADSLGFVIVINGKVQGAEVYGSHALFLKLWPKLLAGAAVDALTQFDAKKTYAQPTGKDIEQFLADATKGKEKEIIASAATNRPTNPQPGRSNLNRPAGQNENGPAGQEVATPEAAKDARVKVTSTENEKSLLLEARDRKDNTVLHRSYIAK
jgi:hypothetical protein